jgi:hypothetical protein
LKYKIEFQYKAPGAKRPEDAIQDDELKFEGGEFYPIPNVGDSVEYQYGDKTVERKVVSRHFGYLNNWCCVTIVVTDISDDEMAARLKM